MKPIDERTPEEIAENIRIYNRAESNHKKVVPLEYGEQAPGAWGEAYRRMVQARERAKKREGSK